MQLQPGDIEVQHNEAASQFQADVDGEEAVLVYMRSGNSLVIVSTRVPPQFRGMGIAAKLTTTAFEYARTNGLSVTPMCSYASTFVRRHPEYRDLVG